MTALLHFMASSHSLTFSGWEWLGLLAACGIVTLILVAALLVIGMVAFIKILGGR